MSEQAVFDDVFGVPSVGGGDYLKAVKIRKGTTTARIVPPVKSQRSTGKWIMYHAVHYGYYGVNKRDPSSEKKWAKPFVCIQEKDIRTQMITRECPKCEQVKGKEADLKAREAEIRSELKGRPEDAVKKALKADPAYKTLTDWLKQHNVDRHHYLNLKLADGSVECEKIPGKAKKALDEEIKKLRARKIDPFDPRAGVFFDFNRLGELTDTTYTVTVAREEIRGTDGQTYERNKAAPLTPADVELIKARAMDLMTAHGASSLTDEQITALVNCDEDPATVDAIFDQAQPVQEQAKPVEAKAAPVQQPAQQPVAKPAPVQAVAKPAPAPAPVEEPVAAPVEDDEEAAALAAYEAAKARKAAAKAAAVAKPAPAPRPAPVAAADEMNADAFIAEFGDPAN